MHVTATYIPAHNFYKKCVISQLPITYVLHVPTVLVLCFIMNKLKIAMKILCDMLVKFIQYMYSECSIEPYRWKLCQGELFNPEPNMLKSLLIIPSSTSQKIVYYSYFVLISLPYYSFALMFLVCIDIQRISFVVNKF